MTASAPHSQPGIAIDPMELWERYLAEVRGNGGEPSPQGAMAFASEYYYDTASELTREISNAAEREAAALRSRVEELTKALAISRDSLRDWLAFAEEELSEFDVDDEGCSGEKLCPKCESSGCIKLKIDNARSALSLEDRS